MLLVMSGIETNPGPCDMVSEGFLTSNDSETVDVKVSIKRPLPMPSMVSKKQRVTETKPSLNQILSAITVLKNEGKYDRPLHLLKPHVNPLFMEICKSLRIPSNRKNMDRTKYLWKRHVETIQERSHNSANDECKIAIVDFNVADTEKTHRDLQSHTDDTDATLHEPTDFSNTNDVSEVFEEQMVTHDYELLDDKNKYEESRNYKCQKDDNVLKQTVPRNTTSEFSSGNEFLNEEITMIGLTDTGSSKNNPSNNHKDHQDAGFWEFWITSEDWSKVKEDEGKYSWFMLRELIKLAAAPVFKVCLICFTTHRKNKLTKGEPVIVYYGKCKHDGCRQFRFDLTPVTDGMKLTVSASGELRHKGKLASRLSGLERSAAKQELLNKKALAFRSDKILKAEAKTVLSGNLLEIRSLDVFRQARAEAAKMMDKHNDDGIDLLLRFREDRDRDGQNNKIPSTTDKKTENEDKIIQKVGEPLHVYMFSEIQLKTLLSRLGKNLHKCVLHIDSTGSVVRPLRGDRKTVYYYSGCVNIAGKLLPVLDCVSCQHDVASITSFFVQYVHFQKKHFGNKRIFSHIVIDFSTALLPAVILAWNRMSVLAYLIKMFRFCTKPNYRIKDIVTVHLCCSHFVHMAAGDLSRIGLNKDVKKFYLCCIASLINCSTFEEFKGKVEALVIISKSKENNIEVEKAKSMFEGDETIIDVSDEHGEKVNESSVGDSEKKTIYKSSPFYRIGKEIEEKFDIEAKANDGEKVDTTMIYGQNNDVETNILHCSTFWDLFLTKYMPYAPLWSGFLIRHSSKEKFSETRFSNAPVEGWFKIVKESVLDGLTNVKVGRFVEKLTNRIMSICKEIYLEIPAAACNKKKVKKVCKEISLKNDTDDKCSIISGNDELVEEHWKKKPNNKKSYFTMKFPVFGTLKDIGSEQIPEENLRKTPMQERDATEIIKHEYVEDKTTATMENQIEHDRENFEVEESTTSKDMEARSVKNSKYGKRDKVKITKYGPLQLDLQSEDYESLQGSNWATGAAIDAVAENMLRNRANFSYFYISFDIGTRIMKGEKIYDNCFINVEEIMKSQYLLLPYSTSMVTDSHWCVVVADLNNKFVYHFDSIEKDKELRTQDVFGKVLKFIENINAISGTNEQIDLVDWTDKSETITYPKQHDEYNCGIFVLYYMMKSVEIGLKCNDNIEEVDIHEFRMICSRTLEDPDTSFFLPAMTNGLIDSPTYYSPDTEKLNSRDKAALQKLTVAYKKNKNMGKFLEKISQTDFASLMGTNWLTSTMVDYCNATYIRDGQFCFAIGEATFALQEGRPKYTPVFKPIITEFKRLSLIFVPYNLRSHFCLYVIDLKNKLVTHIDPMNDKFVENKEKCEKIKEFLRVRNRLSRKETINIDELKFIKVKHPLQNDGSSCGVYVIYYLSQLSGKNKIEDIDLEFDSTKFREQLQRRCLRLSLPVLDLCLACGNGSDKRRHQWCQCQKCGRWIHYLCMDTRQSYERLRRQSTSYCCFLCNLNYA